MRTFDLLPADAVCGELGARIKHLRLLRNLSQQQLADMVGGSLSSVRRLESTGHAPIVLLVRVSQALQVADQLNPLFVEEIQTIAQAERARLPVRQRARLPRRTTRAFTPAPTPL